MSVTLYDNIVPCDAKAVSLNPWRIRFVLNYKKIPYTTVWLPYAEISSTLKAIGAPSTGVRADGVTPRYTVPTIAHGGRVFSNSFDIALYLDEQFPNCESPKLFPPGTLALQRFFYDALYKPEGFITALPPFVQPGFKRVMGPGPDADYFEALWRPIFGTPLDEFVDTQEKKTRAWERLEKALDVLDATYASAAAGEKTNLNSKGCFLGGETPLYVDFVVAACFLMLKLVAQDDWARIAKLHDGRWEKLLQAVEPYTQVQ